MDNLHTHVSRTPRHLRGLSLIELVAVFGVVSILALALAPVLIRRIDIAAVNSETGTLTAISNALVVHVLRSNSIPSEAAWAAAAGNWLSLPSASITTNARQHARACLIDPGGWLGANLPATGYYSQSAAGTVMTNSARIILVSSLSADLPVSSGRPGTTGFNDIWNTAPGTIPATWTAWKGRGDDLLIRRIDLRPLFSQLIVNNRDLGNAAACVIAGQTNHVLSQSIAVAWYINGTVVGLGATNSAGAVLQTSHLLSGNIGFVFENGAWGSQIVNDFNLTVRGLGSALATNFQRAAEAFLIATNSPNNSGPGGAAGDQEQVLASMCDFMVVYALWSGEKFALHGMSGGQAKNHLSLFNYLQNSQTWLNHAAGTTRQISGNPPYYSGLLY